MILFHFNKSTEEKKDCKHTKNVPFGRDMKKQLILMKCKAFYAK
jgi:hypothetical protein